MAHVILLNGVGSAGKTTLARALQDILPTPYLHVQMDMFGAMMPAKYHDHVDGFQFDPLDTDPPEIRVATGSVGQRVLDGMHRSIAAMAACGNNIIVDDVMADKDWTAYARVLEGHQTTFVGVMASLAVLEAREKARGDRRIGLARWQYGRVHVGAAYDITVDTSARSAAECAQEIADLLRPWSIG